MIKLNIISCFNSTIRDLEDSSSQFSLLEDLLQECKDNVYSGVNNQGDFNVSNFNVSVNDSINGENQSCVDPNSVLLTSNSDQLDASYIRDYKGKNIFIASGKLDVNKSCAKLFTEFWQVYSIVLQRTMHLAL